MWLVARENGSGAMKAIVQDLYGPPEVLRLQEIDTPVVGDGDVLVAVHAAAVHPGDYFIMTGVPYVLRPVYGLRRPRVGVRGFDLAGRVETVGRNVRGFQPGDEVFGSTTTGSLAEYVCVAEDHLAPKPARLTMDQAGAVAVSAMAALRALRNAARLQPGQRVLIVGASGGVGTFAVQIAKSLGAEVTGVCSTRNVDLVRSIGADHVIDYTTEDFTRSGQRYDVILDNVEAQPLSAVRRALTPAGTLVLNSGRGGRWIGPLGRWAKAGVRSLFTRQKLRPNISPEKQQDLLVLKDLIEAGTVTPVIDRTYPLSDAAQALAYVGAGHTRGKVVVTL
jgi:NADPH:quinone reductase-like Zn-dependent oxidoreductase